MNEIYFESEYVRLWYNLSQQIGGAVWKGAIPSPQLREAFFTTVRLITDKQLKGWVGDNRNMPVMSQEDQEWLVMMAPKLMATGLTRMATIVSEDVFHHMAVVNLFDRVSTIITFQNQYFRDESPALKWLNAQIPTVETKITAAL